MTNESPSFYRVSTHSASNAYEYYQFNYIVIVLFLKYVLFCFTCIVNIFFYCDHNLPFVSEHIYMQ